MHLLKMSDGEDDLSHYLNLETWPRRDQFLLFKEYDDPFFNICTEVDVTNIVEISKKNCLSFFITSLFASIKAANEIDEFRYRIKDNAVIIHDEIHPGSTVLNDDETFSFCYFTYHASFSEFNRMAQQSLRDIKEKKSLHPRFDQDDLIHYSILPWFSFHSFSHAKKNRRNDSVPKIVFGKYQKAGNRLMMPISIEVNHAVVDGLHVAKYLKKLEEILNSTLI